MNPASLMSFPMSTAGNVTAGISASTVVRALCSMESDDFVCI